MTHETGVKVTKRGLFPLNLIYLFHNRIDIS